MNIRITARHFSASERLQDYAKDSMRKLTRFYDEIQDADVVLEPTADPVKSQGVEVILTVRGATLTATETAATYETALNQAVDNLSRQLVKYKEKKYVKP